MIIFSGRLLSFFDGPTVVTLVFDFRHDPDDAPDLYGVVIAMSGVVKK